MWRTEFDTTSAERNMTAYRNGKAVRLTPETIDHEMETYPRSRSVIELNSLTQEGLEHVALHAQRCECLWDMSRNGKLRVLVIDSCRKLTAQPCMLETAPALETIWYLGGAESTHPMSSLQGFANLPAIRLGSRSDQRLCSAGYDIAPEMRGHGYMTEAVGAVIRYLLTQADANRVYCSVRAHNIASCRVCERKTECSWRA